MPMSEEGRWLSEIESEHLEEDLEDYLKMPREERVKLVREQLENSKKKK